MNNYPYDKVMIVDDSKLDRYICAATIERNKFAKEILNFNAATTAIDHLISLVDTPDAFPQIILLDINMPVMDGFGFMDNYMKLPDYIRNRCVVVMISSTNSPEDFQRISTYPSVRLFFNKPLSEKTLTNIREFMDDKVVH